MDLWTPDIAPAGIAFYTGRLLSQWNGNLFVAELVGPTVARLVMNGERVVAEEGLLAELNVRIRGVNEGPDGGVVRLDGRSKGKILRLVPKGPLEPERRSAIRMTPAWTPPPLH